MKQILLIITLLFLSTINIKAYENEYFKIDIPDSYKEDINEDNTYKWENDNKYISITINDNTELNYDIKSYTKEDIENQKTYIESKINETLKDYNLQVEVTNIEKVKLKNDIYSLNYSIYWPSEEKTGYNMYQIGNVISSDNYIYTIIYNSDEEINNEEYQNIINTFEIKDTNVKSKNNAKIIVMLLCLIAAFLGVFKTIKNQKKS